MRGVKNKGTSILSVTSYEDNELEKLSDEHIYFYNHRIIKGRSQKTDGYLCAPFFTIIEVLFVRYLEAHYLENKRS